MTTREAVAKIASLSNDEKIRLLKRYRKLRRRNKAMLKLAAAKD